MTEYHGRLKGSWDLVGENPVARYWSRAVGLRNRIVHAGYLPGRREAHEALESMQLLETHVGDLLASAVRRGEYLRTGWTFCGHGGLSLRDSFTSRLRRLIDDADQPDWIQAFSHWRRFVDRELQANPPEPGQDPERLVTVAAISPSRREVKGIVHDPKALHAALLSRESLNDLTSPEVAKTLEAVEGAIYQGESVPDPLLIALPKPDNLGDVDWRPDYEIVPDLSIWPDRRGASGLFDPQER